MRYREIKEAVGRIVKGVNTTADVGPDEIKKQAAKFGNSVDKDGRPPTLSKKVKGSKTNVLYNLGLTEGTDKIPVKAGHVLFSDWAKDHIAEHNKPGIGSVFSSNINIENLISTIETLPVQGQGGPYTTKVPGIGYNLVLPYEEAKSLPDAQETTVEKQERGQKFDVPAFKTSAPISQFKTDILTLIIVPSNPQYLPDDVKQDKEILNSIQRKESYSIVTAFPGDPNIPPVSQWNNRYAVVIPDQTKSESVAEKWSTKYKRSINCSNPKGFSQKAHCAGRKKNEDKELSSVSTIYVDMDGVLADFFGNWAKLIGVEHFTDINKKYNIDDALQKIRDTENFWLDLPLTSNAKNLLELIRKVKGSYNICSSPLADDPNSEKHKRTWIEQNLSFFPPDNVYITHNKPQYATQEDGTPNILIDDYGVNINAWEAAGGIGFKYKDHKFERTAKAVKQHMQEPVEEKWSDKYKRSINCNNPKGFSQKAHCAGRKKNESIQEIKAVTNIDKGEEIYIPASDHKKAAYETKIKGYEIYRAKSKLGPMPLEHFLIKDPDSDGFLGELKLTAFYKYYTSDVFFDPRIQGKGLALPLYAYVVKKGYTLVSDREQSKGSQAIWKNLTKVPGIFVYAWDRKHDEFFQWDPEEELDSAIYYDQDKLDQLEKDWDNGKISRDDYRKAKDELGADRRLNDIRLVAIANKQETNENFADGKVKGKSRPGRVKRAGASCNGSVTSLRKRAKNASGEKAKMYHWCANMKSGRNK